MTNNPQHHNPINYKIPNPNPNPNNNNTNYRAKYRINNNIKQPKYNILMSRYLCRLVRRMGIIYTILPLYGSSWNQLDLLVVAVWLICMGDCAAVGLVSDNRCLCVRMIMCIIDVGARL